MPEHLEESDVPEWVKRMREDGYAVRIGSGELSEVPDFMFTPPPRLPRGSFLRRLGTLARMIFASKGIRHPQRATPSRPHAPVP